MSAQRLAAASACVAAGLLLAGPAGAGAAQSVRLDGKLRLGAQKVSSLNQVGPVVSSQLGRGKMTAVSTVAGDRGHYRTTTTIRLKRGTLRLRGTTTVLPTPDGETLKVSGQARIVGGTGRFAGARGTFKVTGSGPVSLKWMLLRFAGTLR